MTATVEEFRGALLGPEVRIEFAATLNLTQGTTTESARVFTRSPGGRWRRVDPLLLPREGGDRADLLTDLATIARGQVAS